jgi:hypothetical protein
MCFYGHQWTATGMGLVYCDRCGILRPSPPRFTTADLRRAIQLISALERLGWKDDNRTLSKDGRQLTAVVLLNANWRSVEDAALMLEERANEDT